jgi:hypothetical protein
VSGEVEVVATGLSLLSCTCIQYLTVSIFATA